MHTNEKIDNIEIRIDRRTTLLGIIEVLSNFHIKYPFLINKVNNEEYVRTIEEKFCKFKNHKVVLLFNQLVFNYDFSFSSPIKLFLQLNNDFTIDKIQDDPFKTRLNNDPKVLELLELLPEFAKEIKFENFYLNSENRHKNFIYNVYSQLKDTNIIEFMNYYFPKSKQNKFIVNLIPWRTYGCYGTNYDNTIYAHLCCHTRAKNEEEMYPPDDKIFNYASFLVHEFSHSFINPIVDKYELIGEYDAIFETIYDKLQQLGYGSNDSILKDHLVRAITLRYLALFGKDISYYNTQLQIDKEWGFDYIEPILDSLIMYEENRDRYENIEKFYLTIIKNIQKHFHNYKK